MKGNRSDRQRRDRQSAIRTVMTQIEQALTLLAAASAGVVESKVADGSAEQFVTAAEARVKDAMDFLRKSK